MSGLFINFFECKFLQSKTRINFLPYTSYSTKSLYDELIRSNKGLAFTRDDDKIYYWKLMPNTLDNLRGKSVTLEATDHPRIFTRMLEKAIVECLTSLPGYSLSYHRYSNTWKMLSDKDLLTNSIDGLVVRRHVNLSVHYYQQGDQMLFGLVLSTSLQNHFLWSLKDFKRHGIDTSGLKSEGDQVFATKIALKRFLTAQGTSDQYEKKVAELSSSQQEFGAIKRFYDWISNHKKDIYLPNGNHIIDIVLRYFPYGGSTFPQEILPNPKRYYFGNRTNEQQGMYYNEQVKRYKPYSYELFENKVVAVGVLCPKEYEGVSEGFISKLERTIKSDLHIPKIRFEFYYTNGTALSAYKDKLYDSSLLNSNLVIVIVNEEHTNLASSHSPYFVCKAKFIGNGIPTQDIQIKNIKNPNQFILNNIALNIYAKLGGTAWTIEKEEKRKDELIIGIGSTIDSTGKHVLGIAQIFHADGRYLVGDCAPLSTFDNYVENLQFYLQQALNSVVDHYVDKSKEFRIIFHLFKSASNRFEIKAIENVIKTFAGMKFQYALVHLGYGHNFRLFFNDGKDDVRRGTYIKLDSHSALIHFVPKNCLPLLVQVDRRSSFQDLYYISKQVYWFSNLSQRSYQPAKKTVTITYPSLMASLTEKLKQVEGWDYDRLKSIAEKLWFI